MEHAATTDLPSTESTATEVDAWTVTNAPTITLDDGTKLQMAHVYGVEYTICPICHKKHLVYYVRASHIQNRIVKDLDYIYCAHRDLSILKHAGPYELCKDTKEPSSISENELNAFISDCLNKENT